MLYTSMMVILCKDLHAHYNTLAQKPIAFISLGRHTPLQNQSNIATITHRPMAEMFFDALFNPKPAHTLCNQQNENAQNTDSFPGQGHTLRPTHRNKIWAFCRSTFGPYSPIHYHKDHFNLGWSPFGLKVAWPDEHLQVTLRAFFACKINISYRVITRTLLVLTFIHSIFWLLGLLFVKPEKTPYTQPFLEIELNNIILDLKPSERNYIYIPQLFILQSFSSLPIISILPAAPITAMGLYALNRQKEKPQRGDVPTGNCHEALLNKFEAQPKQKPHHVAA
jgi:hypothetical protein